MNIFDEIPKDLSGEVFQTLLSGENLKIERIVSKGHCSPEFGWYEQAGNEWVIVLKGEAIVTFEGEGSVSLVEGDYLHIQALKKHKVSWTAPDRETIWLAVHY